MPRQTKRVEKPWGRRNEPGVVHSIEALEDSGVLEVSTPHHDDVVRLRDRYGRGEDAE